MPYHHYTSIGVSRGMRQPTDTVRTSRNRSLERSHHTVKDRAKGVARVGERHEAYTYTHGTHRIASQLNYLRYVIIMFARAVHICNDNNGRCRCDCLSMSGRCHWCSHVPNKDELVCVKRTT